MTHLEYILIAIVIILGFALVQSRQKIKTLIAAFDKERKKRVFPLLELRLDDDIDHAFFLENISETLAKNIIFDRVPVILESGVERTFGFQFDPVDQLKPNEKIRLNYELYYKGEKEADHFKRNLFTHVSFSKIRFRLTYHNIHQTPFKMTVQKTRTHFQLIDAGPLE